MTSSIPTQASSPPAARLGGVGKVPWDEYCHSGCLPDLVDLSQESNQAINIGLTVGVWGMHEDPMADNDGDDDDSLPHQTTP